MPYIFFVSLQTALHWAAKHGNGDIVKLIAGTYKADVNERTVSDKILLSAHHFLGRQHTHKNIYAAGRLRCVVPTERVKHLTFFGAPIKMIFY